MRTLMWFRSDLRVRDNTAFYHACKAADAGVIGVFAVCPKQWREHGWGQAKADFVLRNVQALSASLKAINVPLLVIEADRFDQCPRRLVSLAKKHACDALYFNREHEVNERRRDAEVEKGFARHGLSVHAFNDQTILDVSEMRTRTGGWYKVFTPFKRQWCEVIRSDGPPRVWPSPRRQTKAGIASDAVPLKLRGLPGRSHADSWLAGEAEAHKRLKRFLARRIGEYQTARDFPATSGTSELSPYLAAGVISPRQCLQAALTANNGRIDTGQPGIVTWIGELIWREFYRHVLIGFPRVCRGRPFKPETDVLPWGDDDARFAAWCEGRTGYPIVDAGMRQLAETGWMHNRLRMIVAMFLAKDLFIDWRRGERFFMEHLVDGDFASNNGGWQWSASTGTDAAPYFRVFNPTNQGKRYDADGAFIRRFVPELAHLSAAKIHEPYRRVAEPLDYPPPIVDHSQTRRLVTEAFRKLPKRGASR